MAQDVKENDCASSHVDYNKIS